MDLKLADFLYELPDNRVAKHPSKHRADSKLLFYEKGEISHYRFQHISELIPKESLLVFNDTKVIPARIILSKETGAIIEIFLLEPLAPSSVHEEVMNAKGSCAWKCMIGNAKKWKINSSLKHPELNFTATRIDNDRVHFEWESEDSFSDLLAEIGKIPLPPYINREVVKSDEERYQTVYSKNSGAVAAPTAGLHFTDEVISAIEQKGIYTSYLTLHVSAGTFQPIKNENIQEHPMHNEQIWVTQKNLEDLLDSNKTIAVGTTAMRTLESLYWFGVKLGSETTDFFIDKNDPYTLKPLPKQEAISNVLNFLIESNQKIIGGSTEIFIYPGYQFQMCDGLVTNYHLPGSTLILLVAAFIGEDWRKVYDEALTNGYQFLSYGDSSLLMRK